MFTNSFIATFYLFHNAAPNTVINDATNWETLRIFNTNLQYSAISFTLESERNVKPDRLVYDVWGHAVGYQVQGKDIRTGRYKRLGFFC